MATEDKAASEDQFSSQEEISSADSLEKQEEGIAQCYCLNPQLRNASSIFRESLKIIKSLLRYISILGGMLCTCRALFILHRLIVFYESCGFSKRGLELRKLFFVVSLLFVIYCVLLISKTKYIKYFGFGLAFILTVIGLSGEPGFLDLSILFFACTLHSRKV